MTKPNDPIAYVDEIQAIENSNEYNRFLNYGLSKREYFAAMAMQALVSNPSRYELPQDFAAIAVKYADALILGLNK